MYMDLYSIMYVGCHQGILNQMYSTDTSWVSSLDGSWSTYVTKTMKSDNIMVHLAEAIEGGDKGGSYTW